MDIKAKVAEAMPEIKKLIFGKEEETIEQKFEDIRKVDGTILRIEPSIEVGATVQIIGEDGELMEAPDGDHELENGQVIRIEGGLVLEVLEGENAGENEEEEMAEENAAPSLNVDEITKQITNKLTESILDKVNNLKFAKEEQIAELTDANAKLQEENEAIKEGFNKLLDLVEQIAQSPVAEPKKEAKQPFSKRKKLTLDDYKL